MPWFAVSGSRDVCLKYVVLRVLGFVGPFEITNLESPKPATVHTKIARSLLALVCIRFRHCALRLIKNV